MSGDASGRTEETLQRVGVDVRPCGDSVKTFRQATPRSVWDWRRERRGYMIGRRRIYDRLDVKTFEMT